LEIFGRVRNGVVVLENGATLPEGTPVTVFCGVRICKPGKKKRVRLPLVDSKHPGSVPLTGERIAEILQEEELASFRKSSRSSKS
jgi:hypothetical protein